MSPRSSDDLMIAGTNTNAGKNFVMCGMLRAATKAGARLKPFKPLELDVADGPPTMLSAGMHQKAWSAGVPLEGAMCPFWIVYQDQASHLYLCGEPKGPVSHDGSDNDPDAVRETISNAVDHLKKDGSRLVIEAPGAFSESHACLQVKVVLEILDPDILLVGDFLRGGGLAYLIGTLELLPPETRRRIVGVVLNHIDDAHGSEYPGHCARELHDRYGIPIIGLIPTYRVGFDTISEQNKVIPDAKFDLQVDQLAVDFASRLHISAMTNI